MPRTNNPRDAPEPQPDARIAEREPPDPRRDPDTAVRILDNAEKAAFSFWNVFQRSKYAAAANGPREPGQRPADLRLAAELLRDSMEVCWRAGYKSEHLAEEFIRMMRGK